jgi:penicillin-binding protein
MILFKQGGRKRMEQDKEKQEPSQPAGQPFPWRRLLRTAAITFGLLVYLGLAGAVFAAGAGFGLVSALVKDQPVLGREEMINLVTNNHQTTFIYFRDGTLIGQLRTDEDRKNVTLDQVPEHLIKAFIATEDRTFFENPGIDVRGLARAVLQQLTRAPVQTGGSTITQQLIKLAVLEDPSQTYARKAKEIFLALRLTRIMSKEEILTAYLNEIYFGPSANNTHVYGVQAAAKGIFGVDVDQLNLAQAAYLAGIPQNPAAYTPFKEDGIKRGLERQKTVLNRMLEMGFITPAEYQEALAFDIASSLAKRTPKAFERYPYLTMEIEKRAAEVLLEQKGIRRDDPNYQEALNKTRQEVLRGGYRIITTIDKKIYDAMQEIAQNPKNFDPNKSYTASDGRKITNAPEQVGAVLIHNKTGAILGMVEGRGFDISQVNFATSPRQPGSAMKPLAAYAPAIEEGKLQPASAIDDTPIVLSGHIPKNDDGKYHGLMTARHALNKSYNIPALKVYNDLLGIQEGLKYVKELGVNTLTEGDYAAQTGVIGGLAYGLTVEEITNAYATFANQGNFIDAYLIERIEGPNGELIYQHKVQKKPVFREQTAYLITDMLRTVVTEGTARSQIYNKLKIKRDLAGKTGTTNRNVDLWFIGYTPEISLGVWTGYEINHRMSDANRAKKIWVLLFNRLMELDPSLSPKEATFPKPDGLVKQTVCSLSGKLPTDLCRLAGTLTTDWFERDHLPKESCDVHVKARLVFYNNENYLAQETTPADMVREGVFIKRQPYYVPPGGSADRYRPLDWKDTLPNKMDPRQDDGHPPSAPRGVVLQGATLAWQANPESDVVGYRVYRSSDGQHFVKVGAVLAGEPLQFTDSAAGMYLYRVTAVDVAGKESAWAEAGVPAVPAPPPNDGGPSSPEETTPPQ